MGARAATAGRGALAGLVGALAMTALLLGLRLAVGVPLPVELFTDAYLPTLSVGDFLDMLGRLGGFVMAKRIALVASLVSQAGVGALVGAAYGLLARRSPGRHPALILAGALAALWGVAVGLLWPELDANFRGLPPIWARTLTMATLAVGLALFWAATVLVHRLLTLPPAPAPEGAEPEPASPTMARRTFLAAGAGGALVLLTGGLAGAFWRQSVFGYDGMSAVGPGIAPITPNDRFYVVTKNIVDPRIWESAWRLEVSGLVRTPRTYDYDALAALPAVTREITLECISNSVGGGLMSNARWRGVPLRALLEAAGPAANATQVFLLGADGFTHEVPLALAMRETTLVAYEMNGEPLPQRHGFPVRVLVPGGYGELSVKWVVRIEVQDGRQLGFYSRQGWRADRVRTTSRIDRPRRGSRLVAGRPAEVGGVAFAGDRGISRVELSVDGGRTWREARIDRHAAATAWALWSADWTPARPGAHALVVRATDGSGELQSAQRLGFAPSGASGYHRVDVVVQGAPARLAR